ncbi:hypothetical protein ACQJBY_005973 [Aegilops geniculata]
MDGWCAEALVLDRAGSQTPPRLCPKGRARRALVAGNTSGGRRWWRLGELLVALVEAWGVAGVAGGCW